MALIGVGNIFAALEYDEKADALLSGLITELMTDAVGIVEAVGRSSSVRTGRACEISNLRS